MVIRFPDGSGGEVTYEDGTKLSRQLGTKSLSRWAKSGAVRHVKRRGRNYYAVLDAALLVALEPSETCALGIRRVPKETEAQIKRFHDDYQLRTGQTAKERGKPWDSWDIVFVADSFNSGASVEQIAKAVGRTYDGVCAKIGKLRETGDIPPHGRAGAPGGWQWEILALLTDTEQAKFLKARRAAMKAAAPAPPPVPAS